jgi:hypothetical protein
MLEMNKVRAMASDASRRLHGTDIVAEVAADGHGTWNAKVWRASDPRAITTAVRKIGNLSSAQLEADRLARTTFDHRCDRRCGRWAWDPALRFTSSRPKSSSR